MTGDQDDIYARLRRLMPPWFGNEDDSPVVVAALQGAAWSLAFVYSLFQFAKLQTRIATSIGGWIDLASADYFGDQLRRFGFENDTSYSRRVRLEILRDRNTRNGIDRAVFDLTGNHPSIYEAFRPADCGGWGLPVFALGYTGAWGSFGAAAEVIITTPAPKGYGIPNRPGWNDTHGGVGDTFSLADDTDVVANGPTQADVLKALERVRTAGLLYYVRFT